MRWERNIVLNNEDEWYENEALHLIMMMVKKLYKNLFTKTIYKKINK